MTKAAVAGRGLWVVPLLLMTACTGGHRAAAHPLPSRTAFAQPSPSVSTVAVDSQRPIATWQLHGLTFTTGRRTQALLDVGKSIAGGTHDELRQVALVFPRPQLTPSCVATAALDLTVTGGRHLDQAELAVYASDESNYLSFAHVPNSQLDLSRLVDNRPRGYASGVTTHRVRIDITALYRTWAAGGPFPSQGATVEQTWPFGVIVRPPAADDGRWDAFISNGQNGPELVLARLAGCSGSGR